MLLLSNENKVINTDMITKSVHHFVLSFKDYKNPDFMCRPIPFIEVFNSDSISLNIGPFNLVMPLHWSVLCTDMEMVESIPLEEVAGRNYSVFGVNPIDGYMPQYMTLKARTIFPNTAWTAPAIEKKELLLVPLGHMNHPEAKTQRGPICAIFSPTDIDVNKAISDIWDI